MKLIILESRQINDVEQDQVEFKKFKTGAKILTTWNKYVDAEEIKPQMCN